MPVTAQRYEPSGDLEALKDHPRNPHLGRDAAVARSVDVNGFYGAIIVQEGTNTILAGHTRRRALLARGTTTAPLLWVECDDATALRILLGDNRIPELAGWDQEALAELLSELSEGDLAVAGYSESDLAMLLAKQAAKAPPDEFPVYDESIPTEHTCPRCGYTWSGGKATRPDEG